MSDKTMDDIKSGKGLPSLSENGNSNIQSEAPTGRDRAGITYETFTLHDNKRSNDSKRKG